MNFKHWFESIDNPAEIAKHWHQNLPKEADVRNDAQISNFVKVMSEPNLNGQAIALDLQGFTIHQSRYDKPISNNLLTISNPKLKLAHGLVSNKKSPEFSFYMEGNKAGNLIIQHPPIVYDQQDKILLTTIIEHELGHAADWLNPQYANTPASGHYLWDMSKYATNLHEARRLSEQLKSLLKKMNGDVTSVIKVLQGQRFTPEKVAQTTDKLQAKHLEVNPISPFAMNVELIPVAKAFLYSLGKNEANSSLVYDVNKQYVQEAANITFKILNLFKLHYFINND